MTPSVTKQVRQAVIEQLYEHVAFSVPCLLLVTISWALLFYSFVPAQQTLLWLSANLGVLALRWLHVTWRRHRPFERSLSWLEHELFIGVTITSIIWGSGVLLYIDALPASYRASMVVLATLILTGGSMMLIGSRRCFFGFIIPLGIALLVELGLGSEQERVLACMLAGYLFVFLTSLVRRLRRDHLSSLYHRFANADLAAELKVVSEHLQHTSRLDGLTGIANRAYLDYSLDLAWRRCRRARAPLSLILLDVDYFKQYNDLYGHQAGDECLQQVAAVLSEAQRREDDLAARYGGEEFALLLPATNHQGAFQVAELVRQRIKQCDISHARSKVSAVVTCSIGVATIVPDSSLALSSLIQKADAALYQAKHNGRDRVEVALQGHAA